MLEYTIVQWSIFFYLYCFLGWCIESTIVSLDNKQLINRGFLHGPWLPLYGSGALIVLICSLPLRQSVLLVYVAGMLGATILEYFTGWAMELILKVRYWDYSDDPFNIKGYICLKSSLFWGFLSIIMTYVIHPFIEVPVSFLDHNLLTALSILLTILFVVDVYRSARAVLGMQKFMERVKKIREEIEEIKNEFTESSIGKKEEIESKIKNKREELEQKIAKLTQEKDELYKRLTKRRQALIRNYPRATTKRFKLVLEELKERIHTIKNGEEHKEN